MGTAVSTLVQQFTDKTTVAECSVDELRQIVARYPYFAIARFALLQKLRETGDEAEYNTAYQKALLFYPDPLQFSHFINQFDYRLEEVPPPPGVTAYPSIQDEQLAEATLSSSSQEDAATEGSAPPPLDITPDVIDEPVAMPAAQPALAAEEPAAPYQAAADLTVDTVAAESPIDTQPSPLPLPNQSTAEPANELAFEPYHTVDYFASQGIKVNAEDLGKDKLGKQLRSFTEWLKTMKRLPSPQSAPSTTAVAEQKVERLAGASISEAEVVTEAMAEVWAKQGAIEKATDTYRKLSLLDADKAAYFAAKIESLKQTL